MRSFKRSKEQSLPDIFKSWIRSVTMRSPLFEITVTRVKEPGSTNVGRPTVLGNPYTMKKEADRDLVCDQYEKWFDYKVSKQDPLVMSELRRLFIIGKTQGYLKLGCYCAPRRCHADTIAKFLRNYT